MNTVGISSNALLGNSANNFFEPFSLRENFINIRSSLLIRLPFCFCLCKNYVKRWRTVRWRYNDWRAGVSITHALIGNVGDGIFRPPFYNKKAVLSQRWPRDARYISTSWTVAEIWPFEIMAAAAILNLFESKIAPLDPPSPNTSP